ncbi:F-box and associated interaction domains-containing protein [Theobroma cacao]|uniref:F-box and associated interaction domains-containing protein n=1 Tax=Theobroma cacao TaxID=3641 RepID=A0A061FRI9_THECC|nr:F-box and associated interaction domains-containing protein [Theobroma cacao]
MSNVECSWCIASFSDALATIVHSRRGMEKCYDIWVLNEYSWPKQLTIGPILGVRRPLAFWNIGKLLLESENHKLVMFDPCTGELQDFGIHTPKYTMQLVVIWGSSEHEAKITRQVQLCLWCIAPFNEALATIVHPTEGMEKCYDIWVLNGYSWTKQLTIGPILGVERPLALWKNGELFLLSENNTLVMFDPCTGELQDFGIHMSKYTMRLVVYAESIIPIKGISEYDAKLTRQVLLCRNHEMLTPSRGHGMQSPLTVGLSDWSNCPELGLLGETLGAADFLPSGSVLVMQQFSPLPSAPKKIVSSARKKGLFKTSGQPSAVPFVNHRKADDYY